MYSIELLSPPAGSTRVRCELSLRITNLSGFSWTSSAEEGGVNLSWWWDFQHQDANPRIYLFEAFRSGDSAVFRISIENPRDTGDYLLHIDLVSEHNYWFRQRAGGGLVVDVSICRESLGSDALRRDALLAQLALQPSAAGWREWLGRCPDLEGLSPTEMRLLPWVWKELRRQGVEKSENVEGRLQGLHRKMWYHNKLRMQWGRKLQRQFADRGIDVVMFKGMQLLTLWDWDPGTRPTRDVDIWVRPSQFEEARGWLASWPEMVVKTCEEHSTTFTYDGVHSLDLHRMPHHLSAKSGNVEEAFERAFGLPNDQVHAVALLLANAFVNDAPDQHVGLYTLMDWHRSGVPWNAVEAELAREGLRPVVEAHLTQFPTVVAASSLLTDARNALANRDRWSTGERRLAEAIAGWRRIRASDPPWTFHHWRWTLAGIPPWRRDLRSLGEILRHARMHGKSPVAPMLHFRSRRRQR